MLGWFKMHRKIIDSQIFMDPFYLKLWTLCLIKAAHKPYRQLVGTHTVQLQVGQFVTGIRKLTDEFNRGMDVKIQKTFSSVRRMLQVLESEDMIAIESHSRYSIITIVNWHEYQIGENEDKKSKESQSSKKPTKQEKYPPDNTYYKMAAYYREKIEAMAAENGLKPLTKKANMQSWAKEFQLLYERDGQNDKRLIQRVMDWVVTNKFWSRNVLSAKKFREQFSRLVLEMNAEKKNNPQPASTNANVNQQDYEDAFREWVMEGHDPSEFRYDNTS